MRHSCVNVHGDITGTILQLVTPGLRKGSMGTFTAKKDEEDAGNYPCRKGGGNGNVYVMFYCGFYSVDVAVAFLNH
jgi:hypothetical protein